jgi:DNA-binding PadR family transcriptional regulator
MKTSDYAQNLLPLREPTFFILLSLAAGPRHGYAILKDVERISQDRVSLSTSTLYTAIKRLQELEWISREEDSSSREGGRERKIYSLTDIGRRVLTADTARLNSLLLAANQRAVGENI